MTNIRSIDSLDDFRVLWLEAAKREGTKRYVGMTFIDILYDLLKPFLKPEHDENAAKFTEKRTVGWNFP